MKFVFEQVRTGGDRNFAYLVGDPSYDPKAVVERAEAQGLKRDWAAFKAEKGLK